MPHRHKLSRKKARAVAAKNEVVAARKRRRAKALRMVKANAETKTETK